MKWDEVDKILSLDAQEPLEVGLSELLRRVLGEGRQRMAGRDRDWKYLNVRAAPSVDYPGLSASDRSGSVRLEFGPETEWCLSKNPVRFGMKSPAFRGVIHNENWEEDEMDLLSLRLQLELYEQIRSLLSAPPYRDWWRDWQTARAFPLLGHLLSGTVDLRIGEATMGPLPEYERRLLAGEPTGDVEAKDVQALPGLVAYDVVRGSTAASEGAKPKGQGEE